MANFVHPDIRVKPWVYSERSHEDFPRERLVISSRILRDVIQISGGLLDNRMTWDNAFYVPLRRFGEMVSLMDFDVKD